MPSRTIAALLAAAALAAGCGGDDDSSSMGDERADQARQAGIDAGLGEDVADFLALLARGDTATYRVRFPGPIEGTELVVRNRPPDRRVDVEQDDQVVEVRQVLDGEAFTCTPADDGFDCERTDALVEGPGLFTSGALDRLRRGLAERRADYDFGVEDREVAGADARCLVTTLKAGRDDPELGESGTICASAEGVVLLVDQGEERVEALDYSTEVDASELERVDAGD